MTTFTELYAQEFEWEATKTRKILEAVPDHDPEYRPHEKSMTLMRLAGHIAHLPSWPAIVIGEDTTEMSVVSRGVPTLEKGGRAALLASFEQSVAATRAALATTNDEHLAKNWKFTANGRTVLDLPRTVVLSDVCRNHLIHHRGQLTVYIRLLGGSVPGLYGPSADDKIAMGMPI
jgi:uncharacterized damage-inducible protein DinB